LNCAAKRPRARPIKVELGLLEAKLQACAGVVVAYGGGTDSTAMVIELVRRRVPIRAILFADTGGELRRTYNYVTLFSLWLVQQGYPSITIVRNTPTRGPNKGVAQDLFASLWRNEALPPVAFNFHTCSERFKIRPQQQWIQSQEWARQAWAQNQRILQLVGFEFDEGYRINRTHPLIEQSGRFAGHYPLVEWGWSRGKCEAVIREAGLSQPGKSACFFCPMRKEHEIRELALEEPEKFELALELEARALASGKIRNADIKGLGGRKFSWASLKILARRVVA
jgi:hypothetical protein